MFQAAHYLKSSAPPLVNTEVEELAILATLVAWEVGFRVGSYCPCAALLDSQCVVSAVYASPSEFTPVLAPRVSHVPVWEACFFVNAPSNHGDLVVDQVDSAIIGVDSASVVNERICVHTAGNRSACVDFSHHLLLTRNAAVLLDSRVRV